MNYKAGLKQFDIVSKEGMTIPFIMNSFQEKFLNAMTGKDIILKARQIGYSSLILGIFTLDFLLKENSRSVCISHDAPSAQKLLDRVKFFIKSAEDKGLLVKLKYNSRNELVNEEKNSSFYIGQAGSKSFGRGDTLTNLHLSEFAFYDYPQAMLASALQAVVPSGRTIIESTPNGMNYFEEFYRKSKVGETGFKTHFFDNSFYSTEFLNQKKRELGDDSFKQEYPTDDITCFLVSGTPFFDNEALHWYIENMVREPLRTGIINSSTIPPFLDEPSGEWKIWEEPLEGYRYIVSSDFAQTGDYSAVGILKQKTLEVVATYQGHMDSRELASNLVTVGKWYKNALLIPEVNGAGLALLNALQEYNYSPIYQRKAYDVSNKEPSDRQGYLTTMSTRPLMLGELQALIKEKSLKIYDRGIIEEMLSFIRNPKTGKPEAVSGKNDDRVISMALLARAYQEQVPQAEIDSQNQAIYGKNYEYINDGVKAKWGGRSSLDSAFKQDPWRGR